MIKHPGRGLNRASLVDRQPDRRVGMFSGLGKDFFLGRIECEVRHEVESNLHLESGSPSTAFSLFHSRSTVCDDFIAVFFLDIDPRHFDLIPGIAITGLIEPDAFIDQRIIDRNRLRRDV